MALLSVASEYLDREQRGQNIIPGGGRTQPAPLTNW